MKDMSVNFRGTKKNPLLFINFVSKELRRVRPMEQNFLRLTYYSKGVTHGRF